MSTLESDSEQLLVEQHDRVLLLTLNRPEARNALSDDITGNLRRAVAWAAQDASVGAVVLTGVGTAFCAGGDVKGMGQRNAGSSASHQQQYATMVARHKELAGAMYALRKPTLAALPGAAAGAGLSLALSCDIRVAAASAFLTTAYARIGLSGDYGIAWLLTRVVGPARARELMLTADRVPAERALDIGLVNQVVADTDLQSAALAYAQRLAAGPPVAMQYMKDNLDEALSVDHNTAIEREADRLLKARSTEDHKEAVRAFAEKRSPVFTGR